MASGPLLLIEDVGETPTVQTSFLFPQDSGFQNTATIDTFVEQDEDTLVIVSVDVDIILSGRATIIDNSTDLVTVTSVLDETGEQLLSEETTTRESFEVSTLPAFLN